MDRHQQLRDAGRWLGEQRKRRGLSAREFAKALDVAPQSVNHWETGKMGVSDERAVDIANVLRMDVIDVRRGLGLWVPDDDPEQRIQAEADEHAATVARVREAIATRLADDPEERDWLLDSFDREVEQVRRTYEKRIEEHKRWREMQSRREIS